HRVAKVELGGVEAEDRRAAGGQHQKRGEFQKLPPIATELGVTKALIFCSARSPPDVAIRYTPIAASATPAPATYVISFAREIAFCVSVYDLCDVHTLPGQFLIA